MISVVYLITRSLSKTGRSIGADGCLAISEVLYLKEPEAIDAAIIDSTVE